MNSLLAAIRNRLRLWNLRAKEMYVEASVANAEADMANQAADLVRAKATYYQRMAILKTIKREIALRESPEVILKHIAK